MIALTDIQKAKGLIEKSILRTPLIHSTTFSKMTGAQVYLKLENLQKTGSFKIRGAGYKIQTHFDRIGPEGVVAASAGNHAQGVALAAKQVGVPATILMPEWASITKQEATRGYGGQVIIEGQSIEDCIRRAREFSQAGKMFIHPYDDPEIIMGQGTIALEIFEDLPDPDFIFVPIGGGGLIGGIATVAKAIRSRTQVIGVEAKACPSAYRASQEGRIVRVDAQKSIADGISVKQTGEINFRIIRKKVDNIVLVEEEQIAAAILMLLERKKILSEGSGAVPLAALLNSSVSIPTGSKVVLVISGGNVDSPLLGRILRQGLFRNGRIMRFSVCLDDVPGSLAGILTLVARHHANVLHIYHDRYARGLSIGASRVELELETRSADHITEIADALQHAGYAVELK